MIPTYGRRYSLVYGLLVVGIYIASEVSSTGYLPPEWSQHYHDGKTYYYNQQTGTK
jgi:hypothetical protein